MKTAVELPAGRIPNQPLTFRPQPMERVWGGSKLAELFGKPFPPSRPIGESWEIADRPEVVSIVATGPFAGVTLRQLMIAFPQAMVGAWGLADGRFPWLAKLLDAQENLSLQVHPPAEKAAALGGEPKTEIWYVAAAEPGARVFAGLRDGVTQTDFEARARAGSVLECCHDLSVVPGDVLFVPSGRVHALGAGIVIFELQQNSDTTYRVFDFNRLGLDGVPRGLHLTEALQSIDFSDFSPGLVAGNPRRILPGMTRCLVRSGVFEATEVHADGTHPATDFRPAATPGLIAVVSGALKVSGGGESIRLQAGDFCLLPASLPIAQLATDLPTVILHLNVGTQRPD